MIKPLHIRRYRAAPRQIYAYPYPRNAPVKPSRSKLRNAVKRYVIRSRNRNVLQRFSLLLVHRGNPNRRITPARYE